MRAGNSLVPSTMQGYHKKMSVHEPGRGPSPVPKSATSLQNGVYKPLSLLWCFIVAGWRKTGPLSPGSSRFLEKSFPWSLLQCMHADPSPVSYICSSVKAKPDATLTHRQVETHLDFSHCGARSGLNFLPFLAQGPGRCSAARNRAEHRQQSCEVGHKVQDIGTCLNFRVVCGVIMHVSHGPPHAPCTRQAAWIPQQMRIQMRGFLGCMTRLPEYLRLERAVSHHLSGQIQAAWLRAGPLPAASSWPCSQPRNDIDASYHPA